MPKSAALFFWPDASTFYSLLQMWPLRRIRAAEQLWLDLADVETPV